MKNILMVAGTSLLENYNKISGRNDSNLIGSIYSFDKDFHTGNNPDDLDESGLNKLIENIKNNFFKGYHKKDGKFVLNSGKLNEDASDEIRSIIELQKESGEKVQVHLITSDTVASEKCAELIKYFFEDKEKIDIEITKALNLQTFNEKNLSMAEFPNKNVDIICLNGCSIEYIPILINKYPDAKLRTIILQDIKYESKNIEKSSWGCYRDKY